MLGDIVQPRSTGPSGEQILGKTQCYATYVVQTIPLCD